MTSPLSPGTAAPAVGGAAGPGVFDPGAALLTRMVWAGLTAALLAYLARYGANLPLWDEWQMVPALSGIQPVTSAWLWAPWSEHRVPLVRLALVALARLTACDFRAGMVASVLCLAAVSYALVRAAEHLRGGSRYVDAFFPLVLLNVGHKWNVLQGWNLQNALFAGLAGAVLVLVTWRPGLPGRGRALGLGLCLLLLPLSGGAGALVAPVMALWLGGVGVAAWRAGARAVGLLSLAAALATGALVAAYFYDLSPKAPETPDVLTTVRGAAMFLSTGFGAAADAGWPYSAVAALGLLGFGAALALRAAARPGERARALGLLAFLAASVALALAVSRARAWVGARMCLESRYALLAAPALCAAYLAGSASLPAAGRLLQVLLCAAALLHTPENVRDGLDWGRRHRRAWTALDRDLAAGVPAEFLLRRYDWLLPRWREDQFSPANFRFAVGCTRLLRDAGVGPFRSLADLPAFRELPIPLTPAVTHDMTWDGHTGRGHGTDPYVEFTLPRAQHVYGILISCSLNYDNADASPVDFRVSWRVAGAGELTGASDEYRLTTAAGTKDVGAWVHRPIDRIRIRPDDKPCLLQIEGIVLLAPPG